MRKSLLMDGSQSKEAPASKWNSSNIVDMESCFFKTVVRCKTGCCLKKDRNIDKDIVVVPCVIIL